MRPVERIRELAAGIAAAYGLEVFDVSYDREGGTFVLRVVLDKPGPSATAEDSVSLEHCAKVSEELSAVLDVEDVVPDAYTLEVSSPGLDRPLRTRDDFQRFAGRLAKIVTAEPIARQTAFAGHLRGVEGDDVLFENEGGRMVRLPLGLIRRARLEVEF
ncbi:MAG: ribosome maturation factor RimP [Vicinamibacterales bacterium]